MATLVPCLVQLRAEFNQLSPGRDKGSDGWIGNASHQAGVSDHNPDESGNPEVRDADHTDEVHAIDVDKDLRSSVTMEQVVQFLVGRCKSGAEKRLRYVIFNRRIWSATNGWGQRTYTGSNPHDHHAHFSASYDSARERDASSWHLTTLLPNGDDELNTAESGALTVAYQDGASWINGWDKTPGANGGPHWGVQTLKSLAEKVDELATAVAELKSQPSGDAVPVTQDQLVAALREVLRTGTSQ